MENLPDRLLGKQSEFVTTVPQPASENKSVMLPSSGQILLQCFIELLQRQLLVFYDFNGGSATSKRLLEVETLSPKLPILTENT
jgi:hypothetical protein